MYVLFTGGKAYSGGGWVGGWVCVCRGGGSGGSGPSDKRGGVHPVHEKTGGQFPKKVFRPQFGLKISGEGGGGWRCPGSSPGSATGGCYNRQFTVVN